MNTQHLIQDWEKEFEENKSRLFPEDRIILEKTYSETEYLHETLPIWDLMTGKVTPAGFITSKISEGAIDERKVTMVEKTWKQSEVVKDFIHQAVASAKREVIEEVERKLGNGRVETDLTAKGYNQHLTETKYILSSLKEKSDI